MNTLLSAIFKFCTTKNLMDHPLAVSNLLLPDYLPAIYNTTSELCIQLTLIQVVLVNWDLCDPIFCSDPSDLVAQVDLVVQVILEVQIIPLIQVVQRS